MIRRFLTILAVCAAMTSCTDFDWDTNHETTLSGFDIESGDIAVDLTDGSVLPDYEHTISWNASKAEDYSQVFYKVLFSTDGDFSNPVYELEPAKIGTENSLKISNRTLNIIAEAAGVPQSSTGSVKWTVKASNGINSIFAGSVHTLTVTRPEGFAFIPENVALRNADEGTSMMKKLSDGVFEVFAYMGDGNFDIVEQGASGKAHTYGISGNTLVSGSLVTAVSKGKVHHLTIDFNKAKATITSVEEVAVWYSGANDVIAVMNPFDDNTARWRSTFLFEMVDSDLRYKFRFTEKDASGAVATKFYGYASVTSRPQTGSSPASYFYLVPEAGESQSDYCFSFNRTLHRDKQLTLVVDMSPEIDNYTHTVTVM